MFYKRISLYLKKWEYVCLWGWGDVYILASFLEVFLNQSYRVRSRMWGPISKRLCFPSPVSPLAWKIPWTEEPGGLQSMGSLGVGHD